MKKIIALIAMCTMFGTLVFADDNGFFNGKDNDHSAKFDKSRDDHKGMKKPGEDKKFDHKKMDKRNDHKKPGEERKGDHKKLDKKDDHKKLDKKDEHRDFH